MSENDLLVETAMNRLNPVPTIPASGLDERAAGELAELLAGNTPKQSHPLKPRQRNRRVITGFALAASFALIASVAMFSNWFGPSSTAVASSPTALAATKVDETKAEVLAHLATVVAENRTPSSSNPGDYSYQWWEEAGSPTDSTVIVPVTNSIVTEADGSRTLTQIMGQPFSQVTGNVKFIGPDGKAVEPGAETTTRQTAAEYGSMGLDAPPGRTAQELGAQLDEFTENNPLMSYNTGAGRIDALGYMLASAKFGPESNTAVINYLAAREDVRFDGSVTDRLGRAGYMFSVAETAETPDQSAPMARSVVILEAATGAFIGYERMSVDGAGIQGDSSVMTVTRYIAAQ